jgi:GT2 family glycosyltransferase
MIIPTTEWCLFLDDDLLLSPSAIDEAFDAVDSLTAGEVIGVGLSLPPTTRAYDANLLLRITASFFGIRANPPGRVFKSGHAASYLQEKRVVETQWLNGASLWRLEFLDTYGTDFPSTSYAACEDLIFSYPLSKLGKLIYAPNAKLQFQESELSNFDRVVSLANEGLKANEIVSELQINKSTVSRHLNRAKSEGLIEDSQKPRSNK